MKSLKSLALSEKWDLALDGSGNLAATSGAQRIAQDVASAVRTFQGECLYSVARGIPFRSRVFGVALPLTLIRQWIAEEAGKVPGVASASTELFDFKQASPKLTVQTDQNGQTGRVLSGRIRITTEDGDKADVQF